MKLLLDLLVGVVRAVLVVAAVHDGFHTQWNGNLILIGQNDDKMLVKCWKLFKKKFRLEVYYCKTDLNCK